MSAIDYREYLVKTADNSALYAQSWRPANPIGVIIMVHGYAEHSGRYQWTALQLVDRGFAIYAFDLRGHGKSSGARKIIRFNDCFKDLAAFLEQVRLKEPDKPLFLFGHSLGGTVAALFVIRHKPLINGLILGSTFLKTNVDVSGALLQLVILLGNLMSRLPTVFLDSQTISRDQLVVNLYKADLLIGHGQIPAQTLAEIFKAIYEIRSRVNEIELPLLVVHGVADRLANVEGSKSIYTGASSKDKSIKLYDGMHHELLNEPEKVEVLSDISTWLRDHLPPG